MTDLFDCNNESYLEMFRALSSLEEDLSNRLEDMDHDLKEKYELELRLLNEQRRIVMRMLYNRGAEDRMKMIG